MKAPWQLAVLLGTEMKMQLRQQMIVLFVLFVPLFGLPGTLIAIDAYQSSVSKIEAAKQQPSFDPDRVKLPVSVPESVLPWIMDGDGLRIVSPGDPESLAALTLEGRNAKIVYIPTFVSTQAQARLTTVLKRKRDQLRAETLEAAGIPSLPGDGLLWTVEDLSVEQHPGLALIVPLIMIVMLMVASFTALDVLTGERERGTLETLLSTGARRRTVIAAKTLAVALTTSTAGLFGIAGVAVGGALALPHHPVLSLVQALLLAVATILLSVIATALAVIFAINAPSYRSASLTMGFVVLLPALPAALGASALELTPAMAFLPIGNISLAVRDGLYGTLAAGDAFLVSFASLGWAVAAAALTIGRLGSEHALLQIHDSAALRRAGFFGKEAIAVFGLSLLLVWVVGSPVQAVNLRAGLLLTQVGLVAGVGIGGVLWVGLPLWDTLSLRIGRPRDLVLAIIVGLSAPGLGLLTLRIDQWLLPMPSALPESMIPLTEGPWLLAMALFALLPAICEELMFRGALLGMMRKTPLALRVFTNALMFGAIHLSIHRMLPTAVLGLLAALVAVRSGAILPAMIVHLLNNLVVLMVARSTLLDGEPPLVGAMLLALVAISAVAATGRDPRRV